MHSYERKWPEAKKKKQNAKKNAKKEEKKKQNESLFHRKPQDEIEEMQKSRIREWE